MSGDTEDEDATLGPSTGGGESRDDSPVRPGETVGRYVIVSRIGGGGMGVVYAAYDPELDRKIALKVLREGASDPTVGAERRARLMREAQALARLSHPNVVSVYDVGTLRGQVWLAMEYIDGDTLRTWLHAQPRSWREIAEVMRAALAGLVAAHEVGLLHRDLKPDNLMVGGTGRVVVMDFGLAQKRDGSDDPSERGAAAADSFVAARGVTRTGRLVGTPAYMSPEQLRGDPLDARSDEFSFCVTMWEALYGQRPYGGETPGEHTVAVLTGGLRAPKNERGVPSWLRRITERGLARDQADRFASTSALADVIDHGLSRARRGRWLAALAGVGALVIASYAIYGWARAQRVAACERAGELITETWNDDARETLRAGIRASGVADADPIADRTIPPLDQYALEWESHRTKACLNVDVDDVWSHAQLDRAEYCLEDLRLTFAELTGELARADARAASLAVLSVAQLVPAATCLDEGVLARTPQPPTGEEAERVLEIRRDISRTLALGIVGKYPEALALARSTVERADASDWARLSASTHWLVGVMLKETGAYEEAETASITAYAEAAKASAWDIAADSAEQLIIVVGVRLARHAEGRTWGVHAEVAASFAGDPFGLREATRSSSLARIEVATGHNEEAKALFEHALAILEAAHGPNAVDLATTMGSLAQVYYETGDYERTKELLGRATASTEAALGPDHPSVGAMLANLAMIANTTGDRAEARRLAERALTIFEQAFGPEHPNVAMTLGTLGSIDLADGSAVAARTRFERAIAIAEQTLGPTHPHVASLMNNLARAMAATGDPQGALELLARALAIKEKALGPDHPEVATTLVAIGEIALHEGELTRARTELERAVTIYAAHDGMQENEAEADWYLAQALVADGGDRTRARELATKSAAAMRALGAGKVKTAEEIERWLRSYRNTSAD